ncbi:hypothetical protein ACQJBY_052025 [Aegilops geniculata]
MIKQLGEADSPREGLKRLEVYARSLKDALSGGSIIGASWGDRPGSPSHGRVHPLSSDQWCNVI